MQKKTLADLMNIDREYLLPGGVRKTAAAAAGVPYGDYGEPSKDSAYPVFAVYGSNHLTKEG